MPALIAARRSLPAAYRLLRSKETSRGIPLGKATPHLPKAMRNSEIASYLHISEGTAKSHLTSRADAAKKALRSGLITFRALRA
jgi:hypothetical protein